MSNGFKTFETFSIDVYQQTTIWWWLLEENPQERYTKTSTWKKNSTLSFPSHVSTNERYATSQIYFHIQNQRLQVKLYHWVLEVEWRVCQEDFGSTWNVFWEGTCLKNDCWRWVFSGKKRCAWVGFEKGEWTNNLHEWIDRHQNSKYGKYYGGGVWWWRAMAAEMSFQNPSVWNKPLLRRWSRAPKRA